LLRAVWVSQYLVRRLGIITKAAFSPSTASTLFDRCGVHWHCKRL
jgi:hypothetical protein